jgi:phage-related protein
MCYKSLSPHRLKEICWHGNSRHVAHGFPKRVRVKLGKELTRVQMGLQPRDGRWLTGVGEGVQEIRLTYDKGAYRVIFVAMFREAVHVLHAFQKKSKVGKGTPQSELDLAARRYRELVKARLDS